MIVSCAPKPEVSPEKMVALPRPFDLQVEAANGKAILKWHIARDPKQAIAGYNIFCQSPYQIDTTLTAEPHNQIPYPGDTDGDITTETYEIAPLENGIEYVAFIRTVGLNGNFSSVSEMISFEPVVKGEFVISNNHLAKGSGYCFEKMKSTVARDPENDIYLYATETKIGLSSPHRLGTGLRRTYFNSMLLSGAALETIAIHEDYAIWIQTKYGVADLQIISINKSENLAEAKIEYVFRPEKNKSP